MCHVLWKQFCCSWMYTKTARNRSLLFKEAAWVVKLLHCWSSCKYNDMQHLIFYALLGNFLLVRLMYQQRRQMEVTIHCRCCIKRLGLSILARKIRLAMTVVVESWTTHYSSDPMVLTKWFSLFGLSFPRLRNIFHC